MAYRKIHDDFWTDPDIEELTPEQKFFYLYLITNPSVNQLGLYEFSIRRACFETGYNKDTILKLLEYFEMAGKIKRSDTTNEILIKKFYHHNKSNSPKLRAHINQLLNNVKDTVLIQYIYGMDTLSQEEEEEEEEKKEATRAGARAEAPRFDRADRGEKRPRQQPLSTPGIQPFKDAELETEYQRYLQYMEKEFGRPVKMFQEEEQREFLKNQPDPVAVIKQTLRGGYMKLFPVEKTKKSQEDEWNEEILRRQKDCPMMN